MWLLVPSLTPVCIICVSADFGWWACRFRKRLSVAEPARFWVDQSAGLPLADGHEHGPVHSRIHSEGRGRPAALTSGQRQVKGEVDDRSACSSHKSMQSLLLNPVSICLQALGVSSQSDRSTIKKKLKDLRKAQEKLERQREKKEKEGRRSGRLPASTDSICWGTPSHSRSNLFFCFFFNLYFWGQDVNVTQQLRREQERCRCT